MKSANSIRIAVKTSVSLMRAFYERKGITYRLNIKHGSIVSKKESEELMAKGLIIGLIVLIGLFDYALVVACSRWEDREQYYHEKHLKERRHE